MRDAINKMSAASTPTLMSVDSDSHNHPHQESQNDETSKAPVAWQNLAFIATVANLGNSSKT